MLLFRFAVSCLLIISTMSACKSQLVTTEKPNKTGKSIADKKYLYPQQKIEDESKIWGTYILTQEDVKVLENQKLSRSIVQNIIAFSHQSTWPIALQDMLHTQNLKSVLAQYNTYIIAPEIDEPGLMIYYVPFEQNRQMPDSLLLEKEDFFIIAKK